MFINKVLTTTRRLQAIGLMLFVVAILSACAAHDEAPTPVVIDEPKTPEPISLLFACAPDHLTSAFTRMADPIVQMNDAGSYRPITNFRVIAQTKDGNGGVIITDSWVDNPAQIADHSTFKYYHSGYCTMTEGVNACLVYAKADDATPPAGVPSKVYNGSLKPEIAKIPTYVSSTKQLSFDLNPILADATVGDDGIPADAWTLANALTDIANIEYWNTLNETNLKPLLAHFTNNGYDLAGSAASVRAWIGALKKAAVDMGSQGDGQTEELIRQEIISKADEYLGLTNPVSGKSISSMVYPQNINLPDGAAVLRWTEVEEVKEGVKTKVKKFVPQLQTTTLDDINSVSRFVYPPSLYYFVDSGIWTSNQKVEEDDYDGKTSWRGEVNTAVQSLFTDGDAVSGSTKTVAVADPMQYAVARLNLTVEVDETIEDQNLKYNGTNTIAYTDGTKYNFRLTGVIVGGQRKVGYNFKPTDNSDMDVKFVYDSQVTNGLYLKKKTESALIPVNTLVLQSWDEEDLYVILEMEYTAATEDSKEFKCLNGYVYPGTRFYLVGEVKAKDFKDGTGDEASQGRVFTQDYTTSIEMTVKSLEKAYNVLPNIIAKNLEVGVMTTPKWKAATPSAPIIME